MASAVGRPKLLIVGTNYAPEISGIGPYTALLAESAASELDVSVVTGVPHYPQWKVGRRYRYTPATKERVGAVPVLRVRHHVPRRPSLKGRAAMESTFVSAAVGPIAAQRADAIIAVTPSLAGLTAATLARRGRPLGVVVQDLTGAAAAQTGAAGGWIADAIGRSELSMLKRADSVGVVAHGFIEPLVRGGVAASRIVELPNPTRIFESELSQAEARDRLGWRTDRRTAVHTGNMGLKQGLEAIIEAAALSPDVDYVLVGDGGQRPRLEQLAAELGLDNLRIEPPVTDAEYPIVLAAADVLLLCEAPTVESMSLPSKITSYVVAGRPIVAAVRPDGITGLHLRQCRIAHLTSPDPEGLSAAVRRVLDDEALAAGLRVAQKAMRDSLSVEAAAERYIAFARGLLAVRH